MKKVKLTVVVPVYNVEDYVAKCLDSIINQTLKEIEIIAINDGSTDKSLEIIKEYSKKDERVIVVDQKNIGLGATRNRGLEIAKGKYIYFIDSDDYLDIEALEKIYNKMEKEKLDSLFFDSKVIYETEDLIGTTTETDDYYEHSLEYEKVYSGQEMFVKLIEDDKYRESGCMQVNKVDFLKKNDIKFIEGIIHEDVYFSLKIFTKAKRISYLCKKYYNRLYREGSIMTSTKALNRLNGCFKSLLKIIDLVNTSVDIDYIESFLERERALQNSCIILYRKCNKEDLIEYKNNLSSNEKNSFKLLVENITKKAIYINELENKIKDKEKTYHTELSRLISKNTELENKLKKEETERKELEKKNSTLEIKLKEQDSIKYLIKKRIKTRINRIKRKLNKDK